MQCHHCGSMLDPNAQFCAKCGASTQGAPAPRPQTPYGSPGPYPSHSAVQKERSTYMLLGILLGLFGFPGIHNLYAGRTGIGLVQLLGTVLTCWILWLPFVIWTIIESCTVMEDGSGVPFR